MQEIKTYYVHWVFKSVPQQHLDIPYESIDPYQLYKDAYAFMYSNPGLVTGYKVKAVKPEQKYIVSALSAHAVLSKQQ